MVFLLDSAYAQHKFLAFTHEYVHVHTLSLAFQRRGACVIQQSLFVKLDEHVLSQLFLQEQFLHDDALFYRPYFVLWIQDE